MALLTRVPLWTAAAALTAAAASSGVGAQTLTQDQALALAFPEAEITRQTAFLGDVQLARAASLAGPGVPIESTVVAYYLARRGGRPVGVAYFDVHRVRTLPEVLMIAVGPDDRILRIESVSFHEPPDYRAPAGWLRQFDGAALDDELSLRRRITPITGATLTSGATTGAARRVLAIHQVIDPFGNRRE